MSKVKLEIEALHLFQLEDINRSDFDFWVELRQQFLLPDTTFTQELDLRGISLSTIGDYDYEPICYLHFV